MGAHGRMFTVLGCGHAAWGALAYRRELAEFARSGVVDSVGDGLFQKEHSRDGRASAFWFMAISPVMWLLGSLVSSAERNNDARALRVAGLSTLAFGVGGATVMPRSGFWAAFPIGLSLLRRSGSAGRHIDD